MRTLFFNFYGFEVKVKSFNENLIEKLAKDFSFFLSSSFSKGLSIYIRKNSTNFFKIPETLKKIRYRDTLWYLYKKRKIVVYSKGLRVLFNYKKERAIVFYLDDKFLHEIVYLLILSRTGEDLDRIGLHRVHSLGFSYKNNGILLILPIKGGKTTLALELLKEKNVKLFSDDILLVDKNLKMYPFPLRLGVLDLDVLKDFPEKNVYFMDRRKYGRKYLFDISIFKNKIAEKEISLKYVFIGKRINMDVSKVFFLNKLVAVYFLIKSLVIGIGTPQVLEYFFEFSFKDFFIKLTVLFRKIRIMFLMIFKCRFYRFILGNNIRRNYKVLIDFIR